MENKKNTSTNNNIKKKIWERELKKGEKVTFKNANGERVTATINGFWKQGELVEKDTYTQGGQFNDFRGINLVDEHNHEIGNINACQIEECFKENATITYGYDRQQRSWVILVQDEEGNTIESEYCGDKRWCDNSIKNFKEQYNTTKVKKYKAY